MTIKRPQTALRKSLLVWGIGILRRKLGNYYKKSRRCDAEDHAKVIAWRQWRQKEQTLSPEMRVRQEELSSLVDRIVAGFPPCEQEALNLHLAGLPAHEIALQLYPERYQNVINRLYRGRQKLAKELRRHGYRL